MKCFFIKERRENVFMNHLYRKKHWKRAGIVLLVCTALSSGILSGFEYQLLKDCQQELKEAKKQINNYQKNVYVADGELACGTVISEENVRKEVRYMDWNQEDFFSEDDFGKKLIVDVSDGDCLLSDMAVKVTESVREVFLSEIEIAEHLETGNRVDIRIRYANAEDYTILSDKYLVAYEEIDGMVLRLTEEEILLLSSAIADERQYQGTRLYAVKYPEQETMEAGSVTYIPNKEILRMLGLENAKGEGRIALEGRLEYMEDE